MSFIQEWAAHTAGDYETMKRIPCDLGTIEFEPGMRFVRSHSIGINVYTITEVLPERIVALFVKSHDPNETCTVSLPMQRFCARLRMHNYKRYK